MRLAMKMLAMKMMATKMLTRILRSPRLAVFCCLVAFLTAAPKLLAQSSSAELRFERLGMSVNGVCRPGSVLSLTAYVDNRGEQPVEAIVVGKLAGQPDQQFELRYTFPPKQVRQVPLRIPVPLDWKDKTHVEVDAFLIGVIDGREVILDQGGVPLKESLRIPVNKEPAVAFINISRSEMPYPWWYWPSRAPNFGYEIIISGKVAAGNTRSTLGQYGRPHHTALTDWQSVDISIIAEEQPLRNANTVDSLRRFVHSGGSAWIMMDRIPDHLIRPLLAPGQSCESIDQTQLTQFTVESPDGSLRSLNEVDRTVKSVKPVDFVRAVFSGGEVTHSIDGWPAGVMFKQGDGQIWITTLGANGWIRPRTTLQNNPITSSSFEPLVWNSVIIRKLFSTKPIRDEFRSGSNDHRSDVGRQFAQTLIGNPVAPRGPIALTLIAFVGILISVTAWFGWNGQWQRLAIAVPSLGGIVALGMVGSSVQLRRDISEMSAALNIARTTADGNSSMVKQQGVVNLTRNREMMLNSPLVGSSAVDTALVASGVKRFESKGFDSWTLKNSDWPTGLWSYQAEYLEHHSTTVLEGEFDSEGLSISIPQELSTLEDTVLSFQPGQPVLAKRHGNRWQFDGSQIAGRNRWTTTSMLSSEQLRRQQVLNKILSPKDNAQGWSASLLGWSNNLSYGNWSTELEAQQSTLQILPVTLKPPAIGITILVPSGVMAMDYDQRDSSRSSAYNVATGSWIDKSTQAAKISLKFSLPECLLPFKTQSIELQLDMNAPNRTVKLTNTGGAERKTLAQLEGPSIPWSKRLAADELSIDAEGNFYLQIEVSQPLGSNTGEIDETATSWNVNSFHASCTGRRQSMFE
jgi:hypothetical protein